MAGSATEVLAAMIPPALLISASGTLVLSTSNRLSRVVDRVRVLARDAEQLQATPSAAPDDARQAQAKREDKSAHRGQPCLSGGAARPKSGAAVS